MHLHLVSHLPSARQEPPAMGIALLLEGEWPWPKPPGRASLNECATADLGWIDTEADRLCQKLLGDPHYNAFALRGVRLQCLLKLELRYYLVKLLRFAVVLDDWLSRRPVSAVTLHCRRGRDDDYASVCAQLCRLHRIALHCSHVASTAADPAPPRAEHAGRSTDNFAVLRRGIKSLLLQFDRAIIRPPPSKSVVALCGSPSHLGPLCRQLRMQRNNSVHWFCKSIAMRQYLRFRPQGVAFHCCDSSTPHSWPHAGPMQPPCLWFRHVDLGPSVHAWLIRQRQRHGPELARCLDRLDTHFERLRPQWLLLDEDVTPFKQLAVALARRHAAQTAVVQHGAPYVSFGFAPLAADHLFAWGEASRRQFIRWAVPQERILVTGSPKHDVVCAGSHRCAGPFPDKPNKDATGRPTKRPKTMLLLASVHHRDDRPDLVSFQFTAESNARMIRLALGALRDLTGWKLIIKLHPRMRDTGFVTDLLAEFPDLSGRVRLTRRPDAFTLARRAGLVLSCASSAGIEAMLSGTPVIHLMPAGSANLLHDEDWGFAGTARTARELATCIAMVLREPSAPTGDLTSVFANLRQPASKAIAEAMTRLRHVAPTPSRNGNSRVRVSTLQASSVAHTRAQHRLVGETSS